MPKAMRSIYKRKLEKPQRKVNTDVSLHQRLGTRKRRSGDDSKEEPPVPMPNTEVKLLNVDDTWWVTAWESRKLPERRMLKITTKVVIFGV